MSFRGSILASLLAAFICLSAVVSVALSTPAGVYGYVTVNGAAVSGVTVSLSDGQSAGADGSGFYQFGISNGSSYTVTASYNGHQASRSFTAGGDTRIDLNIAYTTSTATPIPTANPNTGNNGGSGGSINPGTSGSAGYDMITPTPVPTPEAMEPTVAPTIEPTIEPTATPIATAVSTPTAVPAPGLGDGFLWWLIALLAALIVIVGATYFLFLRKN